MFEWSTMLKNVKHRIPYLKNIFVSCRNSEGALCSKVLHVADVLKEPIYPNC